ncbi:MAG: nucleotide-binding protein [Chitinophagaceae bacterium]
MPQKKGFSNENPLQSLQTGNTVKNLDVKKNGRPSIFIGSSTESLATARFVKEQFDPSIFEVDIWDEGVFGKGKTNVQWLKNFTDIYDFAIFIFVPEDEILVQTRTDKQGKDLAGKATRHNVVFEFGLFLGRIGSKKTYILYDDSLTDFIDQFFTDLQYHRDDPDKHFVLLYPYKGQYQQWMQAKMNNRTDVPQYIAASIQPQVQKIIESVKQSVQEVEVGFLPSTSLAIGYYKNFLQIVTQFLHDALSSEQPDWLKKLGDTEEDRQIKETVSLIRSKKTACVKIIMPDSLIGAEHQVFKTEYQNAGLKKIIVRGPSRNMPVQCLNNHHAAAKDHFIIYDIPSTINSSIDAIDLINAEKDIRELLAEKERLNFRKAIAHLFEKNKTLLPYISIISIEEFRKETNG